MKVKINMGSKDDKNLLNMLNMLIDVDDIDDDIKDSKHMEIFFKVDTKGNKLNKENKTKNVATKSILSRDCDDLNKLEEVLKEICENNDAPKEPSLYLTDNPQELRNLLFKSTGLALKNRYIEHGKIKNVLANILDRAFNIIIDINTFKKHKKMFEELNSFEATFFLNVSTKGDDGEICTDSKDPFEFDFKSKSYIGREIVDLKLKACISVYHYFLLLNHLNKDCDKNPLNIINFRENQLNILKEKFKSEINDLNKEIKNSLIENVDQVKFNKELNENMNKYPVFNQFYENLTQQNINLLDFNIVDIFNIYKEKAKIVLVEQNYISKKDEVLGLFSKEYLQEHILKDFFNHSTLHLEKFRDWGIEFESPDTSKNKIKDDLIFISDILVSQGMSFSVYGQGFVSQFLPEFEQPCKYKKWFSKSDLHRLSTSVTEGNRDLVKTMLGRLKKKDIVKVQLINGQRSLLKNLKEEFPNYIEVIKFIDDYLAIQEKTTGEFYFPPVLLDGEPGIGKTFFLTKLAKIFNVESHIENMASVSTGARFTGTEAHWSNCNIGMLLQLMLNWKYANGIILLDEIDKVRVDNHNGPSPIISLLPILERATSDKFMDVSLDLTFDTSNFIWTASSNNTARMHPALLSRFNVFKIKNPNKEERKILTKAIYKQLLLDNSWDNYFSQDLDDNVIEKVVEELDGGSARKTRRILQEALANAASDGSRKLKVQHLIDRPEAKSSIGFMN